MPGCLTTRVNSLTVWSQGRADGRQPPDLSGALVSGARKGGPPAQGIVGPCSAEVMAKSMFLGHHRGQAGCTCTCKCGMAEGEGGREGGRVVLKGGGGSWNPKVQKYVHQKQPNQ